MHLAIGIPPGDLCVAFIQWDHIHYTIKHGILDRCISKMLHRFLIQYSLFFAANSQVFSNFQNTPWILMFSWVYIGVRREKENRLTEIKKHEDMQRREEEIFMKRLIAKLAAALNRMKALIDHMYAPYLKAVNDLRGTPAYADLFSCDMMM